MGWRQAGGFYLSPAIWNKLITLNKDDQVSEFNEMKIRNSVETSGFLVSSLHMPM